MEDFIRTYGYWAVTLGVFLEGEAALIAGAFAAHRGYLSLHWVIALAFFLTLCLDWGYFFLGRFRGRSYLEKRPNLRQRIDKVYRWLERNPKGILIGFRFLYGFRILIPILVGTTQINTRQFLLLSGLSTLIWALVFGLAGYFMGVALTALLDEIKRYELTILGVIVAAGLLYLLFHRGHRQDQKTL